MITRAVKVTRQCKQCQKTRTDYDPLSYIPLHRAMYIIKRARKECACCGRRDDMEIIEISIEITDGWIFGDPMKGIWKCSCRRAIYYPGLLTSSAQRLQKIENDINSSWDDIKSLDSYDKVVMAGYPWKCPECGQELYYYDDREIDILV